MEPHVDTLNQMDALYRLQFCKAKRQSDASVSLIKQVAWKLNGQFTVIKVQQNTGHAFSYTSLQEQPLEHYKDFNLEGTFQRKTKVYWAQKYTFVYYSKHKGSVNKRNTLHTSSMYLIVVGNKTSFFY